MRNRNLRPIQIVNDVPSKECIHCGIVKVLAEFNKDHRTGDGLKLGCRDCTKEAPKYHPVLEFRKLIKAEKIRQRMHDDPQYKERRYQAIRNFWMTPKGRADRLWRSAMKNRRRMLDGSTLTLEHVLKGVERGTCEVTGFPFDLASPKHTQYNPFAPSLDRVNPNLPYTDENVRVVIWQYNLMKGEISDCELYLIAHAIIKGLERKWQ